ncbi:MAG TPA: hypothetical protein VLG67_02735 [Candidatus Saccharimonadales bacterium]|nr:hypothetical protein [Candidatus Saccharimonadales bacterium]
MLWNLILPQILILRVAVPISGDELKVYGDGLMEEFNNKVARAKARQSALEN